MNRQEFFKWLYHRFEKHWASEEHFNTLKEDYKIILTENVDYVELHKATVKDYQETFKPPAPAYFYKLLQELRVAKQQAFKKYEPFKGGVPPTKEFLELGKKLGLR